MDTVELLRRLRVLDEAMTTLDRAYVAVAPHIEVRVDEPDRTASPRARFVIYPTRDGQWEVASTGDRTPFWVDHRSADEAGAVQFVWRSLTESFVRMWVASYPPMGLSLRTGAAVYTSSSPDELVQLAGSADPAVVAGVARNRFTPSPVLDALAAHENAAVRWAACGNPSLSPATLAAIIKQADFGERWHIAYWQPLNAATAISWSADDRMVAMGVLQSPSVLPETLAAIARQWPRDESVGNLVAANRRSPTALLLEMVAESSPSVAWALLRRDDLEPELVNALMGRSAEWLDRVLAGMRRSPALVPTLVSQPMADALKATADARCLQLVELRDGVSPPAPA